MKILVADTESEISKALAEHHTVEAVAMAEVEKTVIQIEAMKDRITDVSLNIPLPGQSKHHNRAYKSQRTRNRIAKQARKINRK